MVGMVYKLLLAPEVPKPAPDCYPDFFVHVAVPFLTTAWWVVWGPKDLSLKSLPIWLILPAAYCAYALIRGWVQGSYPYFFVDITELGLGTVLVNCVGLVFVFGLCGTGLWLVARLLRLIGELALRAWYRPICNNDNKNRNCTPLRDLRPCPSPVLGLGPVSAKHL